MDRLSEGYKRAIDKIWGPLAKNHALLVILGQILTFLAHLVPCLTKKTMQIANNLPRWFFRYMGTKTFASSHKNLDFWP